MPACGYEFYLRVLTRYLTSERSERVRYRVEHEKIKFVSTSGHEIKLYDILTEKTKQLSHKIYNLFQV